MRKKKARIYEGLKIEALSSEGLGIAKVDEKVIFVESTIPGDVVNARTFQRRKKFEKAKVTSFIEKAANRQEPFCPHFEHCGGCKWQYISYEDQLNYKEKIVQDAMDRLAKIEVKEKLPILAAPDATFYRNKMEYTFSANRWLSAEEIQSDKELSKNALGFHVPGQFFKVVDIYECFLQNEFSNQLRNALRDYALANELSFYNIKERKGFLRNLVVRTADTGQQLIILIVSEENQDLFDCLDFIKSKFPTIHSLNYIINQKVNDSYYDLEPICYHGEAFITEKLGEFSFKIRPKSFFQTNTKQGKRLYDVVKMMADLKGEETLYDLYSGVGSIGLYLSDQCKTLVGIEQIGQAVEDAKENAKLNKIENAYFYEGDVRMVLNEELIAKHGKPEILITDPPRAGMHQDVIDTLLKAEINKIVYVSCNPATQARDLALLGEKYTVLKMQAVDMFPQTVHIENVALLTLKA